VVSVSDDRSIKVWDPFSSTEVGTLIGHAGPVRSASFAPSSKKIVTASDDRSVKIWDVSIGEKEDDHSSSSYFSSSSAFSSFSDSSSSSSSKTTATPIGNLQGHAGWINDVKMSSLGDTMFSVSDDASFSQWDVQTLERVRVFRSENERAYKACDINSAGNLCVTTSDDGVVALWDLRTARKAREIALHAGPATSAVFNCSDGFTIVSAGWDKKVLVTDSRKDKSSRELLGHEDWILSVALSPDGQTIVSGGWDKTLCLWNSASGTLRSKISDAHTHTITGAAMSTDGRFIATASYDGSVKLWSSAGKVDKFIPAHHGRVHNVVFAPKMDSNTATVVSVGADHTARVWDTSTPKFEKKNEFVCQGPATAAHYVKAQKGFLLALGDSIGNLYLTKFQAQ